MNLQNISVGKSCRVTDIHMDDKIRRRLEALGILEGTRVEVLNCKRNGAMIIKVRGARWALGSSIVKGIEVEELSNE